LGNQGLIHAFRRASPIIAPEDATQCNRDNHGDTVTDTFVRNFLTPTTCRTMYCRDDNRSNSKEYTGIDDGLSVNRGDKTNRLSQYKPES
jgi:hypothetical protein